MLALYRSGRQTEALAVYHDARQVLTEELGLEPTEELRRLERSILVHDPDLDREAPAEGEEASPTVPPVRPDSWRLVLRARWRPLAALAALAVALLIGIAIVLAPGSAGVVPDSVAVIDAQTNRLVGSVPVGRRPTAVAYGEGGVWVANGGDGTVSRIDPSKRKVVSVVRVGADVRDLATGFGAVWVAGGNTGTLTRIDPASNQVVETIRLNEFGDGGGEISFVAAGAGAVWVTRGEDTVVRVDPVTNQVVSELQVPTPSGLAAGLGAAWLVTKGGQLLKIVPRKFEASIEMSVSLYFDALAPTVGAGSVWVIVYRGTGEIWRVDPTTGAINTITPTDARFPLDLAVAERSEAAWAVDSTGALVRVNPQIELAVEKIRTASTIHSAVAVGGGAVWVAIQD
jgi:hypothetical protein